MYLFIPIFILVLPADFFDEGESICISTIVFNTTCYGCGMTKAVMHFIHLDFQKAIEYHKLVVVVIPLLMYSWGASLLKLYKRVIYKL